MGQMMNIGNIGALLDDTPGLWIIQQVWDCLIVRSIDDPAQWLRVDKDNFWVLL
jgi:hypothetical protein